MKSRSLLRIRSTLFLDHLAHAQIPEHHYRVLPRTLQDILNGADTLAMQTLLRIQPTEMDEGVNHLRFLIRSQWGHSFRIITPKIPLQRTNPDPLEMPVPPKAVAITARTQKNRPISFCRVRRAEMPCISVGNVPLLIQKALGCRSFYVLYGDELILEMFHIIDNCLRQFLSGILVPVNDLVANLSQRT